MSSDSFSVFLLKDPETNNYFVRLAHWGETRHTYTSNPAKAKLFRTISQAKAYVTEYFSYSRHDTPTPHIVDFSCIERGVFPTQDYVKDAVKKRSDKHQRADLARIRKELDVCQRRYNAALKDCQEHRA